MMKLQKQNFKISWKVNVIMKQQRQYLNLWVASYDISQRVIHQPCTKYITTFFTFIKEHDITWNKNLEVKYIPCSNIVDLITEALVRKKHKLEQKIIGMIHSVYSCNENANFNERFNYQRYSRISLWLANLLITWNICYQRIRYLNHNVLVVVVLSKCQSGILSVVI